jgi:hypothetical protein
MKWLLTYKELSFLAVCHAVLKKIGRFLHVIKLEISNLVEVVKDVAQECAARKIAWSLSLDRD